MNLLNRLAVILAAIALIIAAALVIVLAWAYAPESIHRLSSFAQYLNDHDNTLAKVIITLGGAFVILIVLSLLILELAPRRERAVVVQDVAAGSAVLSTAAIARRLEQVVMELPAVDAVKAKVVGKNKAVEVTLQVMVDPESDLAAIAGQVAEVTQDAVTRQMSVVLAKPPQLRLYYSYRAEREETSPRWERAAFPAEETKRRARTRKEPPPSGEPPADELPTDKPSTAAEKNDTDSQ